MIRNLDIWGMKPLPRLNQAVGVIPSLVPVPSKFVRYQAFGVVPSLIPVPSEFFEHQAFGVIPSLVTVSLWLCGLLQAFGVIPSLWYPGVVVV